MKISPEFPDYRYQDPLRSAEQDIYRQTAASDVAGQTFYEVHASPFAPEVDFLESAQAMDGAYSIGNALQEATGRKFFITPRSRFFRTWSRTPILWPAVQRLADGRHRSSAAGLR